MSRRLEKVTKTHLRHLVDAKCIALLVSSYSHCTAGLDQLKPPPVKRSLSGTPMIWRGLRPRRKYKKPAPRGPNGEWTEQQTRAHRGAIVRALPGNHGTPKGMKGARKITLAKVSMQDE